MKHVQDRRQLFRRPVSLEELLRKERRIVAAVLGSAIELRVKHFRFPLDHPAIV